MHSLWTTILLVAISTHSLATNIFVSSYAGTVTTLSLTESNGKYSLTTTSVTNDCAPNPSWLTLDPQGYLYCLNEGLETINGSLSTFKINNDGTLTHIQNITTISGPVSGVFYGSPSNQALALAHYTGSSVSSWLLNSGNATLNQELTYTLSQPGPNPTRQDSPHEHEALLDPTGQYLLVPDLGADLVRVYTFNHTLRLKELSAIKSSPGNGPRHATFYNPYGVACETCTAFLYVVNELAATVSLYQITYLANKGGLDAKEITSYSTYPIKAPAGTAPSEIWISPDNRFLLVGNRNDSSLTVNNPDPKNSTKIQSDTITTFTLEKNGTLGQPQLAPSYGSFPRHFMTDKLGNLVAVGNQQSSEVVILARDTATGLIGDVVASVKIEGQITCVVFDDVTYGASTA